MTKEAAIFDFFNSFGVSAYEDTSVPDDVVFPYLTYQGTVGVYDNVVSITARLFYYTDSNIEPNAKAQEIANAIAERGGILRCDDGIIRMFHGNPWCLKETDATDPTIKVRIMNIEMQFLSN